jgi:hypothetical protein
MSNYLQEGGAPTKFQQVLDFNKLTTWEPYKYYYIKQNEEIVELQMRQSTTQKQPLIYKNNINRDKYIELKKECEKELSKVEVLEQTLDKTQVVVPEQASVEKQNVVTNLDEVFEKPQIGSNIHEILFSLIKDVILIIKKLF